MFKNKDKEIFNKLSTVYIAAVDFKDIKDMLEENRLKIEGYSRSLGGTLEYIVYDKDEKVAEFYTNLEWGEFGSNIYKNNGWQEKLNLIYDRSRELYKEDKARINSILRL